MSRWYRTLCRVLKAQVGFSLAEVLVSVAILGIGLMVAGSLLYTAQRSGRSAQATGDQNAELRLAIQQIGEDLAFANWCRSGIDCTVAPCGFMVAVSQPIYAGDWNAQWGGPGYVTQVEPEFGIRYLIDSGRLIRQAVKDPTAVSTTIYSSQVLATGLLPCQAGGSVITSTLAPPVVQTLPNNNQLIVTNGTLKIELRKSVSSIGGNVSGVTATALGEWHLRRLDYYNSAPSHP